MTFASQIWRAPRLATLLLVGTGVMMLANATPSTAALGDVGFQIKLSENEMVLNNPTDTSVKMYAMWDLPYQRIAKRSMPWIELTNLGDSTGNLTQFTMTIGDTDYNFSDAYMGEVIMVSDETPYAGGVTATSTGDLLTVNFGGGGLAPGQTVTFGVDIDPDAGIDGLFPHPDFRMVLFDMNNLDGNGVSDNSIVTGLFTDPANTAMTAMASTTLDDYDVDGPESNYFNQFVRPYGVMEGIDIFSSTAGATAPIPEPATAVLAGLAMLGFVARYRRR